MFAIVSILQKTWKFTVVYILKQDNVQLSRVLKTIINIAILTTINFVAIQALGAEEDDCAVVGAAVVGLFVVGDW